MPSLASRAFSLMSPKGEPKKAARSIDHLKNSLRSSAEMSKSSAMKIDGMGSEKSAHDIHSPRPLDFVEASVHHTLYDGSPAFDRSVRESAPSQFSKTGVDRRVGHEHGATKDTDVVLQEVFHPGKLVLQMGDSLVTERTAERGALDVIVSGQKPSIELLGPGDGILAQPRVELRGVGEVSDVFELESTSTGHRLPPLARMYRGP